MTEFPPWLVPTYVLEATYVLDESDPDIVVLTDLSTDI